MRILTIFLFFILGVTVQAEKLVISILDFKGEDVSEKNFKGLLSNARD